MGNIKLNFFFASLCFICVMAVQLIPERVQVKYENPKYVVNVTANVRRNSRRSPYYLNINITTLQPWYNNVSLQIKFYEYLHNEYRESFIDVTIKWCDFVKNTGRYVQPVLDRVNLHCPLLPSKLILNDLSTAEFNANGFNYKFPFQKGMVWVYIRTEPAKELMTEGKIFGRVEN